MKQFIGVCFFLVLQNTYGEVSETGRDLQESIRNALLNRWQEPKNEKLVKDRKYDASFSWSDCTPSGNRAIKINSLSLGPSPLRIPGNITLATDAEVLADIDEPIDVKLDIKKKVLFWIPVPCIDGVGSCNYPNICPMLEKAFPTCPPEFTAHNIPCHCPAKQGNYSLPITNILVNPGGAVPSWLEEGEYEVTAHINRNHKHLLCLSLHLGIKPAK